MTTASLPDHPESAAEYAHLQATCDVIAAEIDKLEKETGVGAEENRQVAVPQDATTDELVALDIFRMKHPAPTGQGLSSGLFCAAGLHSYGRYEGNALSGTLGRDDQLRP